MNCKFYPRAYCNTIYIYIYVCVCVCVCEQFMFEFSLMAFREHQLRKDFLDNYAHFI